MNFKQYITSIIYISIVGILIELFVPKTNLKKYISACFSLIVIFTIISPIINVLKEDKVKRYQQITN